MCQGGYEEFWPVACLKKMHSPLYMNRHFLHYHLYHSASTLTWCLLLTAIKEAFVKLCDLSM